MSSSFVSYEMSNVKKKVFPISISAFMMLQVVCHTRIIESDHWRLLRVFEDNVRVQKRLHLFFIHCVHICRRSQSRMGCQERIMIHHTSPFSRPNSSKHFWVYLSIVCWSSVPFFLYYIYKMFRNLEYRTTLSNKLYRKFLPLDLNRI